MNATTTPLEGLIIIEPRVHKDDRGYFFESYNANRYQLPHAHEFVQDNEAKSNKGVLRGLHFQKGEFGQGKLVRVVTGSVYDVAVDIRPGSETFGKWYGIVLSGENKKQLWVPRGFAHGYLVLEDDTVFTYKCDNFYNVAEEEGIAYDDPAIGIEWPELDTAYKISVKDSTLGFLSALKL